MQKIVFDSQYFNITDTLYCGQLFRFKPFNKGYLVYSKDKCCYAYLESGNTVIECNDLDKDYFYNYFDLQRNYALIAESAMHQNSPILKKSAQLGKGVRILNQNLEETLFSFVISQNNNIPRIKGIIERLSASLGEKKEFLGQTYYSFPSAVKMAGKPLEFYKGIGLGYRAEYILRLALSIKDGFNIASFSALPTADLRKKLISIYGVGRKVADCVLLFGYRKTDSFPVDTWIEKVYIEDFDGTLLDRNKIAEYFVDRFKENAGYFQQYLFYYKRSLEKTESEKK